jgi:hypothetical protein
VTGAIALAWSEFPAATAAQLRWAFTLRLLQGKADLIAFGSKFLANPDLPAAERLGQMGARTFRASAPRFFELPSGGKPAASSEVAR